MFYCFIHFSPKPPALLVDSSMVCSQFYLPLQLLCAHFPLPLLLPLSPYPSMFRTLHLSNHSVVSIQPPSCAASPDFPSYFLFPAPPLCLCVRRQVLSLAPLLRLSLCIVSCPQPTAWLTNGLSFQRIHITLLRRLYLPSPCYFIAVTTSQVVTDTVRLPPSHKQMRFEAIYLRLLEARSVFAHLIIIIPNDNWIWTLDYAQNSAVGVFKTLISTRWPINGWLTGHIYRVFIQWLVSQAEIDR